MQVLFCFEQDLLQAYICILDDCRQSCMATLHFAREGMKCGYARLGCCLTCLLSVHSLQQTCSHSIASFPGPAQLSVAFSTEKQGGSGIFSHVGMMQSKTTELTACVSCIFNLLHAQHLVCTAVGP